MNEMTVAAQLFTLRDFLNTPEDIRQTLKKVKAIGYIFTRSCGKKLMLP